MTKLTIQGRVPKNPNKPMPDAHYGVICWNGNWMKITDLTQKQFERYLQNIRIQIIESLLTNPDKTQHLVWKREAIERLYANRLNSNCSDK